MNSGAKQRSDPDGQSLPTQDNDPEEKHITEPQSSPHSNSNSNPLGTTVKIGAVMWAGPATSGAGARSAGPEASNVKGRGGASAVTGGVAALLPHPPGAGLAPPRPLPAVTPLHSADPQTTHYGIAKAYGSAANDAADEREDVQAARTSAHEDSTLTEHEAFQIVKAARSLLTENEAQRRARKDTPASESTIRDYEKKCRQIADELDDVAHDSPDPLFEVMAHHARRKQTFQALKSALRWQAWTQLREALSQQDRLQRAGQRDQSWKHIVLDVRQIVLRLHSIDALDRHACLDWLNKPAKHARSKRLMLPRLADGWRDQFLRINQASTLYRHAGVLLVHTGLRPTELAKGVRVRLTPKGVRVLIAGGKVRATAGQPWRTFLLNPSQLPDWFMSELQQKRRMVVQAQPDALRSHLYKMSQRVLNPRNTRRDQDLLLSAYLFRHALVTDMRENGWETEQIAAVIGESSAQTTSYYGTRRNSGSRKVKPQLAIVSDSVRTPRAVRPIDTSGLKAQLNRKRSVRLPQPKR